MIHNDTNDLATPAEDFDGIDVYIETGADIVPDASIVVATVGTECGDIERTSDIDASAHAINTDFMADGGIATLDELIAACHQARGNRSFFERQDDSLGNILLPARRLYAAIVNDDDARNKVRSDPAFHGNKRITNDAGLLAVKLVLRPRNSAESSRCSNYARIVDYAFKQNLTDGAFVEFFVIGQFMKLLGDIRAATPKRTPKKNSNNVVLTLRVKSSRTILATVNKTVSVDDYKDETKRAGIIARLIQEAASAETGELVASLGDPTDGSQVSDDEPLSVSSISR